MNITQSWSDEELKKEKFSEDPRTWLAQQAKERNLSFLLAHADDGVIWGQLQPDGSMKLSSEAFADPSQYPTTRVTLRIETLQQVRLFDSTGELLLWRTDTGFSARLIADDAKLPDNDCLDDSHWLWGWLGDEGREAGGFTFLFEGKQGLVHAPPITGLEKNGRVQLKLRHYIAKDDQNGQAYICGSRLTGLEKA